MQKQCCKCKNLKNVNNFGKLNSSKDGLKYDCNDCRKIYRENNKEKIKEKQKKYYNDNKELLNEQNKQYRVINIEKINKQRALYRSRLEIKTHIKEKNKEYLPIKKQKIKEKRKSNKNFQISEILRSKIHKIIKKNNTSYINIIGCDLEFLNKWLEFRFDKNMNCENLGKYWQIDHILPINSFDFNNNENKYICFHWTNLQPLESKENRSKTNKLQLHYYYNNIVNIHRFNTKYKQFLGYQAVNKSLQWLRLELRYGKNAPDEYNS